jgi:hypothetical protein
MKQFCVLALVLLACSGGAVFAGSSPYTGLAADFRLTGTSHPLVHVEVTDAEVADTIAVSGWSVPAANAGIGVRAQGGYMGVLALATETGFGSRFGIYGLAENGSISNYGVYGSAAPGTSSTAVYANGNLQYTGSFIGPVSDLRLKENVVAVGTSLPRVMALEVVSYEHRRDPEFAHLNLSEGVQVGFIAQQVAEVFPDLVIETVHPRVVDPEMQDLALDQSEPNRLLALKQMKLIPHLVRAIQEQQAQIDALEAQLTPLKRRLATLEGSDEDSDVLATAR